jgi:hypothetical protein
LTQALASAQQYSLPLLSVLERFGAASGTFQTEDMRPLTRQFMESRRRNSPNNALLRTGIPLLFIPANELWR